MLIKTDWISEINLKINYTHIKNIVRPVKVVNSNNRHQPMV